MDYHAFTDDTLLMMHHGARGALAVDDELTKLGQERRFRVRQTPDWIEHVSGLEAEMFRRSMSFDAITWSEDQASASDIADIPRQAEDPEAPPTAPASVGQPQSVDGAARLRSRIAAVLRIGSAD